MKRLFFAEFIIFASITTAHASTFFDSVFVGKNAYVAPCQIADGTYPDYEMAAQCNRWCNSRYASWVDDSTYNFVTVIDCDSVGVTPSNSRYSYCCVNNSVTGMINGCVCQGAHKTTILGAPILCRSQNREPICGQWSAVIINAFAKTDIMALQKN